MKTLLAVAVLVMMSLAGCTGDGPNHSAFDGDAALAFVEEIVYEADGSLRPRHPAASGQEDTVQWLAEQMDVIGWGVRLDPFTGADYMDLQKGAVTSYYEQSRYCGEEDRDELPGFDFTNLYATFLTNDATDGHVVLAAHWDAKEDAHGGEGPVPGANDGASGVGLLLELQRYINQENLEFPFDLTIAFFDGEDGFEDCHPLAGSLWAARTGSLGDVSQLILLDMVGDADARFIRDSTSLASDRQLLDAVWEAGHDMGLGDQFTDCEGAMLDDHVPFHEEGVQVIDIIDAGHGSGFNCVGFQPYWHTPDDTPDKLSADMLGAMGDLVVWILTDPQTQALLVD